MKVFKKIIGFVPALALAAMLSTGVCAQGVVDDVIDGAENIVDDTVDTAEDIVGGEDDTIGTSDTPEQVQDDAGKDENFTEPQTDEADPNPATGIGIPFTTAGLVALSAAGVVYLTRKREGFGK